MNDKAKAIVAHIYWIGWVIALIMNTGEKKEELTSFYLRQLLGLFLLSIVVGFFYRISLTVGSILSLIVFIFWILSIIGAIQGDKKETPWIGKFFQQWFSFL